MTGNGARFTKLSRFNGFALTHSLHSAKDNVDILYSVERVLDHMNINNDDDNNNACQPRSRDIDAVFYLYSVTACNAQLQLQHSAELPASERQVAVR